jgi:hypothetical protein
MKIYLDGGSLKDIKKYAKKNLCMVLQPIQV